MTDDLQKQYHLMSPRYNRLRKNLIEAIHLFLEHHNIKVLSVSGRVKELESFLEKCERKKYEDPFLENEDFIGIRIIVYYPFDIDRVLEIIDNEFDVQESEDKSTQLNVKEFGYRSIHKIIKIKNEWCSTPNYRSLEDIKAEIQVRTVLMHAWAEIEHELQYKQQSDVPTILQRKLFRLSAKFEEADEQFQELKEGILRYVAETEKEIKNEAKSSKDIEINLNTLKAYLERMFPERISESNTRFAASVSDLIFELEEAGYTTIQQIDEKISQGMEAFVEFEKKHPPASKNNKFHPVGVVRCVLEITDSNYRKLSIQNLGFDDHERMEPFIEMAKNSGK